MNRSKSLAVLLLVACLTAILPIVQAGFTGDIPAITIRKTGNLLEEIELSGVTVRVGIAKVSGTDPKDSSVVYVWETEAEFSVTGIGKVAGVDPKDGGVMGVNARAKPKPRREGFFQFYFSV